MHKRIGKWRLRALSNHNSWSTPSVELQAKTYFGTEYWSLEVSNIVWKRQSLIEISRAKEKAWQK